MRNFDLIVTSKSGESAPIIFDNCSEAIAWLAGYGDEESTRHISIEVIADDGRRIRITIPNDASNSVSVEIDEPGEAADT
jgi:hypothetical protein